ncbi:DUF1963 domain-containing protein [Kitasatospora sp. NPDC051914]|uniref:DUF1963 domain-containing protein n=1 Tax=Kitasatospora sp. NPDC051914 TaxID=3154945 RepID=UPI0034360014
MTILMTDAGPMAPDALLTRTGGVPLAPAGTDWPHCATCGGPMQFLAQILLDDLGRQAGAGAAEGRGLLALFMCQNDPGGCQEWSADAGGNRALVLPADGVRPLPLPDLPADHDGDPRLLGAVRAVAYRAAPGGDHARARLAPHSAAPLGRLGGEPEWLQYEQTPDCPSCEQEMAFVAQLEEGPDSLTAMNFGSGCAYAFACEPCGSGAFLWQC